MKLSRKFLNDYLDIKNIDTKELAEKMVFIGNEYESINRVVNATNLVIGEVLECDNHPDSDHLHVLKVNIGKTIEQIVCGASNVRKGLKVIVSLPGAKLDDIEIKKTVIRGIESNGMICSLKELGLDKKYLTEQDIEGIHELDKDAKVGENPIEYLELDDETINFELTANRGDLLSIIGMAYEVGAIYEKEVKLPDIKITKEVEDIEDYLSLEVKTDKCPVYLARMVKDIVIKESPKFIKSRLIASGIRPINNVVDISNYVMLEYGQPLHFFDYETLGKKIVVRQAKENEKMTTLDSIERELSTGDIVITDGNTPVALAGVMGGLNTEIENTTKTVVIESAVFDSLSIRLTSKKILRSEASNRFEKGLDKNNTYSAVNRAVELLEKYADATIIKNTLVHDKLDTKENIIEITKDKITRILGIEISEEDILDIFRRLGFTVNANKELYKISVPTRKLDIKIEEDLIEEVGRIYGIDKLIGKLPKINVKQGKYDKNFEKEKEIRNRLHSLGLMGVSTYTLINEKDFNKFTIDKVEPIRLSDPLTIDRAVLRNSLISSLLDVVSYNFARKEKDLAIYEISKVYAKEREEVKERTLLTALITGNMLTSDFEHITVKSNYYYLKGIVENLLKFLGFYNRFSFEIDEFPNEYHPYRTAIIKINREIIGYIGQIHPKLSKEEVYAFELNLTKIFNEQIREIKCKDISKYPTIVKDIAVVLDDNIKASNVTKTIEKAGSRLLINTEIFDLYKGENIEENKKSLAFKLSFGSNEKTLNEEEINVLIENILNRLDKDHGAKLRDK